METESLTPQALLQPTPPVAHFPKKAVIFGIALIAFLSVFVVGALFYFKIQSKTKIVIYGERNSGKHEVVFYSVDVGTKEKRRLFSIPEIEIFSNEYAITGIGLSKPTTRGMWDLKLCPATNKIYFISPINLLVKEIDLTGKIRSLDFTGAISPDHKNAVSLDTGFALSRDCKKIVWSTVYYDDTYSDTYDIGYDRYVVVYVYD